MTFFLEMHGITKTFPGVKALNQVDLQLARGEVHVLAGENGAGKSTLMKIMTGVYRADPGGVIKVDGQEVTIKDPVHARTLGISIIYQELAVVNNLTVAENIYLAREPLNRLGLIDIRKMNADAAAVLAELEMNLDPTRMVGGLSIGQKQMVEIARAISYRSKLIIMDEPTASLSHHEATTLMRMVKNLAAQNIGVAEREAGEVLSKTDIEAHGERFQPRLFKSSSTANENTSMPPASQWAFVYSIASTWL